MKSPVCLRKGVLLFDHHIEKIPKMKCLGQVQMTRVQSMEDRFGEVLQETLLGLNNIMAGVIVLFPFHCQNSCPIAHAFPYLHPYLPIEISSLNFMVGRHPSGQYTTPTIHCSSKINLGVHNFKKNDPFLVLKLKTSI